MRSAGERLLEILIRFQENEVSRAETLSDVIRVYRSTCENCKYRKAEAHKLDDEKKNLLEGIDHEF